MPNVVLNKTSGSSGQIVVQVTPEVYIEKKMTQLKKLFLLILKELLLH